MAVIKCMNPYNTATVIFVTFSGKFQHYFGIAFLQPAINFSLNSSTIDLYTGMSATLYTSNGSESRKYNSRA